MLILGPHAFGIFLDVWKLKKASKVESKDSFPYFTLTDKDTYAQTVTKQYDEEAMYYLGCAMYPLMACYTVYSVVYNEHKGWYSFILNTLVGGIYLFGFIQMTPQLYINYRLKSVEHMPSKTLFYRFLNTIIDDLFSFIITMPTMHRISCFRDDFIFVIYIYQRWIYRVDKTRGMYATEEAKPVAQPVEAAPVEAIEAASDAKVEEATVDSQATAPEKTQEEPAVESKKDR